MTNLSSSVSIKGLSKKKLIAVIGTFTVILSSALLFGIFTPENDNKAIISNEAVIYQENRAMERVLTEIISKKVIASAVVESIVPLTNNKSESLQMIPPVNAVKPDSDLMEQARIEYTRKLVSGKYSSLSSKSLIYSNRPAGKTVASAVGGFGQYTGKDKLLYERSLLSGDDSLTESTLALTVHGSKINKDENYNAAYLASDLINARSPYEVKAGSVIPAIMINGLNSDLPGQVVAQVRENVYDSSTRRFLLIPQGAKLVGLYDNNISYGQERILVAWNRLIYQDGSSINLKAMPGTDLEGYAGFYDLVDNKYWKIFGSSFIMGVITGAMQYSQNNTNANVQSGGIGISTNPTIGQTMAGSLGQQLGQTGLAVVQKNLNVQPTLIVRPNYPFNIMLTADMVLRPINNTILNQNKKTGRHE